MSCSRRPTIWSPTPAAFVEAIRAAAPSLPDRIVTFGITPDRSRNRLWLHPAGRSCWPRASTSSPPSRKSPSCASRCRYLDEGGYSWNSGVFFFAPDVLLEEFSHCRRRHPRRRARSARSAPRRIEREILPRRRNLRRRPQRSGRPRRHGAHQPAPRSPPAISAGPTSAHGPRSGACPTRTRRATPSTGSVILEDADQQPRPHRRRPYLGHRRSPTSIVIASGDCILIAPRDRAQDVKKVIPGAADAAIIARG